MNVYHTCSLEQWEAVAELAMVLPPQNVLRIAQQIPSLRKIKQGKSFQEPIELPTTQTINTTTQTVQSNFQ